MLRQSFADYWRTERIRNHMVRELGICHFSRRTFAGNAHRYDECIVVCPENKEWAKEARKLGQYRPKTKTWHFLFEKWDVVMQLAHRIYGQSAIRVDDSNV